MTYVTVTIQDHSKKTLWHIENAWSTRLDKAARKMQVRVRSKFMRSSKEGSKTSNAGQYPRYLNKIAANSVRVTRVPGRNAIRFGYGGDSVRHRMRLRYLEKDVTIRAKGGKAIAVPLSKEAKKFSSAAPTKAAANIKNFKPPKGELEMVVLGKGKKRRAYLGVKNGRIRSRSTGKPYTLHFMFVKAVTRRARKGLNDALNVEFPYLVKLL
tara:strand:+ start:948 stop:1580 length:633 start_codon:yes stop_codon:yes gene_type:complete